MTADAGKIVVCKSIFPLPISCSVPDIYAIEVRSCSKSHQKECLSAPNFFWGEDPQILDVVFKITPISDHVAKFCSDRPRDRGDLALKKKRKERNKQQQNTRAVLRYGNGRS